MKGLAYAACAALALAACIREPVAGPAPPSVRPPPAAEPAITPAPAENPDTPFRYAPPVPGTQAAVTMPGVEDIRLPNGMRILVMRQPDSPIVGVGAVLRWTNAQPRLHSMIGQVLLRSTAQGRSRSLRDELADLGTEYGTNFGHDTTSIGFFAASPVLDDALGALFDTLKSSDFTQEAMNEARDAHIAKTRDDSSRGIFLRRIRESLFPAGDPYREPSGGVVDDVRKVSAAEMRRFKDTELRPEIVTVCAVGDTTSSALSATLSRLTASWKPAGAAPVAKRPALKIARGVFLADAPGMERASVAVVLPVSVAAGEARIAGWTAWRILSTALEAKASASKGAGKQWKERWTTVLHHRDADLLIALAQVPAANAGEFVEAVLAEIDRIAQGNVTRSELRDVRPVFAQPLLASFDGTGAEMSSLIDIAEENGRLDGIALMSRASLELGPQELSKAAKMNFQKQQVRVVALGDAAAMRESLAPLGLGPVTMMASVPAARTK